MPSPGSVREREISSLDDLAKRLRSTTRVRVPAGAHLINKVGPPGVRSDSLVGGLARGTQQSRVLTLLLFVAGYNRLIIIIIIIFPLHYK